MRYLNYFFVALLAAVAMAFAVGNWKHVEIALWSGLIADVNLPLLLLASFLLGFLPMALWHQAVKWRLKQRLATAERSIADVRNAVAPPPPADAQITPVAAPVTAPPATA